MTRALALTLALLVSHASAQDPFDSPFNSPGAPAADVPPADTTPADAPSAEERDSQLYQMMQMLDRYEDPKQAVRRKAEEKAAQRRDRLASQKWYGYSPLRPTVSAVPWTSRYGSRWVGGSSWGYYGYHPLTIVRLQTLSR